MNSYIGAQFKVLSGVRQGGILSPILFNMYVDDIIEALKANGDMVVTFVTVTLVVLCMPTTCCFCHHQLLAYRGCLIFVPRIDKILLILVKLLVL